MRRMILMVRILAREAWEASEGLRSAVAILAALMVAMHALGALLAWATAPWTGDWDMTFMERGLSLILIGIFLGLCTVLVYALIRDSYRAIRRAWRESRHA